MSATHAKSENTGFIAQLRELKLKYLKLVNLYLGLVNVKSDYKRYGMIFATFMVIVIVAWYLGNITFWTGAGFSIFATYVVSLLDKNPRTTTSGTSRVE